MSPPLSSSSFTGTLSGTAEPPIAVPAFVDALSTVPTDALVWIAIGVFVLGAILQWQGATDAARYASATAWVVFGVFWLSLAPYFYSDAQSPLETMLALAALPLCVYTGYLLARGRESLLVLSRAVAFMGLIYLPAETLPFVRTWLIETTAAQTHFGMELLGHGPGLSEGANGYRSRFAFDPETTATGRTTYIVLACTGIGSMAIFGGLIAAVTAPLRRKAAAFALAVGVIWILNLFRNVFIGLATPYGWFQYGPLIYVTTEWMGSVPERTSFLIAHNFVAQTLSVFALVGITYLVIKVLPEVLDPLEDVLFVVTGNEYDLTGALAGPGRVRTDGAGGTDRSG